MKTIFKFAVGAAIAGALVNMLMKQRSGNRMGEMDGSNDESMSNSDGPESSYDQNAGGGTAGYTVEELIVADSDMDRGLPGGPSLNS
jgi:hypothetical protein